MADHSGFQQKQYAFAAHIRDPHQQPAPDGIEDRRMAVYRELFFNNLFQLLSSTFPVLFKLYGKKQWGRLIRAFMVRFKAETPYFLEIPKEFIEFLQSGYEITDDDPPFLLELAHYEWAELALSVSDDDNRSDIDPNGDLIEGVPVKSVLAWLLSYQFPVHRISPSFQPTEPPDQPTILVVYRKADDELGFMELNPVTARLLELIEQNDRKSTGRELLQSLAKEINYPDPSALLEHGGAAMAEMRGKEILLGTLQSS